MRITLLIPKHGTPCTLSCLDACKNIVTDVVELYLTSIGGLQLQIMFFVFALIKTWILLDLYSVTPLEEFTTVWQ